MRISPRLLAVFIPVALAAWLWAGTDRGKAAEEGKTPRDAILRIAEAMAHNHADEAQQLAGGLKDVDVDDIMPVFSLRTPRNKRALGLGPTPGAIRPDGIEKKLEALASRPLAPAELTAQAEALERAAYVAAAVGVIIRDKCPVETKQGNKDPKEWRNWSEEMVKLALDFASAVKSHDPTAVKRSAERLDANCKSCHAPFK